MITIKSFLASIDKTYLTIILQAMNSMVNRSKEYAMFRPEFGCAKWCNYSNSGMTSAYVSSGDTAATWCNIVKCRHAGKIVGQGGPTGAKAHLLP